jgi:alpha/beta superfamily hydrolase
MTRIYRTGDLARWLPNGDIEFAGRVDHQIKVGSYRIEPGEIEVAIAQFPGVLESIVVHEEIAGQKYLIAYVAVGRGYVEPRELLEYLRTVLPVYMLPPRYVMLESLPKTINGKIDRKSLPAPETSQSISAANVASNFVAPRSETERRLCEVWKSVLQLPTIDVHDDFFALGGSSLLVTRIVASVTSDFGVELPVRDFFANPTIATSASHIDQLLARGKPADGNTNTVPTSTAADEELLQRLPLVEATMIPCEGGQLFSVRYQPKSKQQRHGVLICNSIGHEHVRAYRNLQQLAMRLVDRGYDVLRFDYRGTGNSSGACEACNAETFYEDTQAAAAWLRKSSGVSRLSVVGVRLGATIAAGAGLPDVDRMILWDPVVSGQAFCKLLDSMHDHALSSQTRFVKRMKHSRVDQAYGHAMSAQKRSSLKAMALKVADTEVCREGLILYSREGRSPGDESISLSQRWCTVDVPDEIHWHHVGMAERAFSSPGIYNQVLSFLDAAPPASVDAPPLIFDKTSMISTELGAFSS